MNCTYFDKSNSKCLYPGCEGVYYCIHHEGIVDVNGDQIITKNFSDKVYFGPWIGKNYEKRNYFGRKVLVLGNSVYCRENQQKDNDYFAKCLECGKCVKQLRPECCYYTFSAASEGWSWNSAQVKAFQDISGLADNEFTEEEYDKVRDSVAFYNYIQEALSDGSARPSQEQYANSEDAFFEVLETLRPEVVVALGVSHMWNNMPYKNFERLPDADCEGYGVLNGFYSLNDGTKIPTIWIYHPSSRGSYDAEYRHRAIEAALK